MVVFVFPQCHGYGGCWRAWVAICSSPAWMVRIYITQQNLMFDTDMILRFNFDRVPGVLMLLLSWLLTFYTLWQLVEMHELVPGKRFDRYYEIGEHLFGPKKGLWMVMPQQLTVQVASTIVYTVTGGKSLKKFFQILTVRGMSDIRQTYYILFFIVLQIFLSQTPNFHQLKAVSSLAAVMSIWYVPLFGFKLLLC